MTHKFMINFKNNPIVMKLIGHLCERRVIPFIGAGVSANVGLPGWNDLVKRVALALKDEDFPDEDFNIQEKRDLLVAIEYLMIQGESIIPNILRNLLDSSQKLQDLPTSILHISKLNVPAIYTTNWDNLLEDAYEDLGKPYISVAQPEDLTKISNSETPILKYHGSIQFPKTMVISESHYYERFGIDSPFDLRLRSDMMSHHFLFLGYSMRDYNVRYIWNRTQKIFRNTDREKNVKAPCAYFVATRRDHVFHKVLEANNICVIQLMNRDEFAPFVEYLSNMCN